MPFRQAKTGAPERWVVSWVVRETPHVSDDEAVANMGHPVEWQRAWIGPSALGGGGGLEPRASPWAGIERAFGAEMPAMVSNVMLLENFR